MQELVTVEQVEGVLRVLAWAGPLAGLIVGLLVGLIRRGGPRAAWRGLAVGLIGPIIYLLWLLFGYLVRYNPQTEKAGLHSVATLALSALLFMIVGALLGAFYRRVVFADEGHTEIAETAPDASGNNEGQ